MSRAGVAAGARAGDAKPGSGGAAPSAQSVADRLDELPTLPSIVYELNRVIGDPMSSTADVERVMAGDQAMTAKVLRLANSAYYAIPGGVTSLQRAVAYIGYDAIQQLVLSASIIQALSGAGAAAFDVRRFWMHSLGVAMASEKLGKALGRLNPHDLFTCGLVHDMGKVALMILEPELFLATVAAARERGLTFAEAEEALGSPKHAATGRALAERWRLPASIQACCGWHHQPDPARRGGISSELSAAVDVVYLSNLVIHALKFGDSGHGKALGLPRETMDRMRLTPEKTKDLIASVREALGSVDGFLKVIGV